MLKLSSTDSNAELIFNDVKRKARLRLQQIQRVTQFALLLTALDALFIGRYLDSGLLLGTALFLFSVDWAIYRKRITLGSGILVITLTLTLSILAWLGSGIRDTAMLGYCGALIFTAMLGNKRLLLLCLLYTSPSPRDRQKSRMPSSA